MSSEEKKVNLDTSVVVNYVLSSLPGDIEPEKGSSELIEHDSYFTAVGGKAKQEFNALCERRHDLYADVVEFMMQTGETIYQYDPSDRGIHVSDNDRGHFRCDVQMSWHDKSSEQQLSLIRRCYQELEVYQLRVLNELINECFPKQSNPALLKRFQRELDIGHDCEILVDAVEISQKHAIPILVAIDTDITDPEHIKDIRTIIVEETNPETELEILEPDEV